MNLLRARCTALAVFVCALVPFMARAGDGGFAPEVFGRALQLPAPPGYVESGALPRLRSLAQSFVPEGNELVANFVRRADLEQMRAGRPAPIDDYFLVEVSRVETVTRCSPAEFVAMTELARTRFQKALRDESLAAKQQLDRAIAGVDQRAAVKLDLRPGQVVPVGEPQGGSGWVLTTTRTRIAVPGQADTPYRDILMATVLARVGGRVLFIYAYARYTDPLSVGSLQESVRQFTEAAIAANPEEALP